MMKIDVALPGATEAEAKAEPETEPTPTYENLLGARKKVVRPLGTITAREYGEVHKVKQKTASEFLLRLYRQGKAERFNIGNIYCYRLK